MVFHKSSFANERDAKKCILMKSMTDSSLCVASLPEDGAAMRAGVQTGDRIIKVSVLLCASRGIVWCSHGAPVHFTSLYCDC